MYLIKFLKALYKNLLKNRLLGIYMIDYNIKSKEIISYYMRTSKGIKSTAGWFGLPISYVGKIINEYKKKNGIR